MLRLSLFPLPSSLFANVLLFCSSSSCLADLRVQSARTRPGDAVGNRRVVCLDLAAAGATSGGSPVTGATPFFSSPSRAIGCWLSRDPLPSSCSSAARPTGIDRQPEPTVSSTNTGRRRGHTTQPDTSLDHIGAPHCTHTTRDPRTGGTAGWSDGPMTERSVRRTGGHWTPATEGVITLVNR
jgi:hypothetical protein